MDRVSSRTHVSHNNAYSKGAKEPDITPTTDCGSGLHTPSRRPSFPTFDNAENSRYESPLTPNSQQNVGWHDISKMRVHVTQKRLQYEINNLPTDTLLALESYVDILTEMQTAVEGKESRFASHPEELASLTQNHKNLLNLLKRDMNHYRASSATQMWNLASGLMGFVLCFAPGTLASSALTRPWLAIVISPFFWILTERLIPMIRATSWANKHADTTYPLLMRLVERTARDWIRAMAGLPVKKYPGKTKTEAPMTARAYLSTLSMAIAWKGKVGTDDMPYLHYTLCYALRHAFSTLFATTAFLRTGPGVAISLCSLFIAGCCAGASTSATLQARRRNAYKSENPKNWTAGQSLVKSREIWEAEALFIESQIKLLDVYSVGLSDDEIASNVKMCRGLMKTESEKANIKSGWLTSFKFEIGCLFQEKRLPGSSDAGEVAGRRVETIASYLGKATALAPAVAVNQMLTLPFTTEDHTMIVRILVGTFAAAVLIFFFGFRKEAEMFWRAVVGIILGFADVIKIRLLGASDKYPQAPNVTAIAVTIVKDNDDASEQMMKTISDNSGQSSSDGVSSKELSPTPSQKNANRTVDGENFFTIPIKNTHNGKKIIFNTRSLRQPNLNKKIKENSTSDSENDTETS
jgi:hypothetical protein